MSRQREKAQISVITSRGVKRGGCREWSGELNCWSDADANKWLKDTAAAHIVYWPSAEAWRWPEPGGPERTVLPGKNMEQPPLQETPKTRLMSMFRRRSCRRDRRSPTGAEDVLSDKFSQVCSPKCCTVTTFLTNELIGLQLQSLWCVRVQRRHKREPFVAACSLVRRVFLLAFNVTRFAPQRVKCGVSDAITSPVDVT